MIVGLGHQARVGKDTAAQILVDKYGFRRLAFADRLKEMALDIDPFIGIRPLSEIVEKDGWEGAKTLFQVRRFLQNLGVAAREHLGENVWVNLVLDQIKASPKDRFVITDVRFPNEFKGLRSLRDRYVRLVKITRPGVESNAGSHISETALANADWDQVIWNNRTIDDLERALVRALGLGGAPL